MIRKGDTLIEVIFAFAILSMLIGTAFTGVIQARKSALAAQQRTQALLMAQYQTNLLTAYRDGLPWDDDGGSNPSFMLGSKGSPLDSASPTSVAVPPIEEYVSPNSTFCVKPDPNRNQLIKNSNPQSDPAAGTAGNCDLLVPNLPAPTTGYIVNINFYKYSYSGTLTTDCNNSIVNCDSVKAEININWTDPYGNQSNVNNIVILNK